MTEEVRKALEAAKTEEEARKIITENKLTEEELRSIAGGYCGPNFVYVLKPKQCQS